MEQNTFLQLNNSFSHDSNTYSFVLNYDFGEKIEIL